jgi:hypothetical protein
MMMEAFSKNTTTLHLVIYVVHRFLANMERGESRNAVIQESSCYKLCTMLVDNFLRALDNDFFPDVETGKILAVDMDNEAAKELYGAVQTLFLRGRCSRTMLELALIHSETSYPEYMELWIRSLPPIERSMYAARLYNGNLFAKSVPWDYHFYKVALQDRRADYDSTGGELHRMPTPPRPLGDHRHTSKRNNIRNAAYFFYHVLHVGYLFDDNGGTDCNYPLYRNYTDLVEPDMLLTIGPVFGIKKSDLVFGERSDHRIRNGKEISPSERILRCWNVLYHARRLCLTELEDALVRGPVGVRDLLERGVTLMEMTLTEPTNPVLEMVKGVKELLFDSNQVEFTKLAGTEPELMECDYCGEGVEKKERCSKCKVAMYCNRDCQKSDWKRHKWLCSRYCCQTALPMSTGYR